ncbi:MAG: hypothetical protein MN733_18805 [Nitrososphaera sp.]|nr:hypothetical protein [Nitrososphaera sp.]
MIDRLNLWTDAMRYRKLCELVEMGEWSVAHQEVTRLWGGISEWKETYMHDREHMNSTIDKEAL